MKYKIYRLKFTTAVHFGSGRLGSSDSVFQADRLFSAMCIEAARQSGAKCIEKLVGMAKENRLFLSDAMPYIGETLYIPKPVVHIGSQESDSAVKKAFKKLRYIPANMLDLYLSGGLDAQTEAEKLSKLGKRTDKISARVTYGDDTLPYRIGTYEFSENCGLYFILGYEDDDAYDFADNIIYSLQYEGIGGKISSGLGKFDQVVEDIPESLEKRLSGDYKRYMSLSVCLAKDGELEKVVNGAEYSMLKRSGFINSQSYAEKAVKKRDMYCFAAGSCFGCRFEGDVFNAGGNGAHPVYRYAKPMLLGVFV